VNIAVIGWGSLIWYPGSLLIKTRWFKNGPLLPIEFARISSGDRLTLVLFPGRKLQPTFWAISEFEEMGKARENLRIREGAKNTSPIHGYDKLNTRHGNIDSLVATQIKNWLRERNSLDGVIWAGFQTNWEVKRKTPFNAGEVVRYLQGLDNQDGAKEYIRNAPCEIRTEIRNSIERELGWNPNPLSRIIFEEEGS